MRKPKAYIAGPVRGNPNYYVAFLEAAKLMEDIGFEAINPMENCDVSQDDIKDEIHSYWLSGGVPPYVQNDIDNILKLQGRNGDLLVLLPNWESSPGAKAEKALAEWIGVKTVLIESMIPYGAPPTKEQMSPRGKLEVTHSEVCRKARDLMSRKNHDYASETDPFRNFRAFGRYGILVRLSDKLARLRSFEEQQALKVPEESVQDTVQDIINYAILYLAYE